MPARSRTASRDFDFSEMNISYRWLRTLAPDIDDSAARIAERLGMLGAPVDEISELGGGLGGIVIAQVKEVRPHPNADRLRLCEVDAGGDTLQVVCGAPNVEAGRFYPFAPVGSSLPDGMRIRKAKLRGEVSEGMLCSAKELGLGRDHAGLLTLSGEWEPGTSFVQGMGLEDTRLVLDITPNRPDLLSHLGVARELAAGGEGSLRLPPLLDEDVELEIASAEREGAGGKVTVTIEDPEGCPRYMAAVVEGVTVAPSPEWLATRLRSIDVRPINNVVDATNYVLHELGQPLHAFDLDRLAGPEIRVRRAREGESLVTLDGVDRRLDAEALVIADRDGPVALAGIMGGEDSEVTEATTRVLLECALFDPLRVRGTARALGLSTDASHRFERGVDPTGQPRALHRLIELIVAVAGGTVRPPAVDAKSSTAKRIQVLVRGARIAQVLGVQMTGEEVDELLRPIGFSIEATPDGSMVAVPAFRPDVTREIDVIEEIARRRGYDSFGVELSFFRPGHVPPDPLLSLVSDVHALFQRWGLLEARTAAFAPAGSDRVPLLNPLSMEESHLRGDLADGLLRRVEHNWAHGVRSVRLYEIGTVFGPAGLVPREETRLAAVLTGPRRPSHWSGGDELWDFWDLKALLLDVAELVEADVRPQAEGSDRLSVHSSNGDVLGQASRVDPAHLDAPAWAEPVYALELTLRPPPPCPPKAYVELPAFPAVERDLALVTPAGVEAGAIEESLRARGGLLLERVAPFDIYEGEGIPAGTRSIAWRLRFRHPERTLTDDEIDAIVAAMLRSLEEEHGVRRR
ncbi:MAG: phenylalanine--tRNA ligase subunit beta [Gemmatimonas sp.]|nr:phenylalanine--tRNA ligase subunit beta [Gemmatimonas sp.]